MKKITLSFLWATLTLSAFAQEKKLNDNSIQLKAIERMQQDQLVRGISPSTAFLMHNGQSVLERKICAYSKGWQAIC